MAAVERGPRARPGHLRLADLARALGVSRTTVSNAFSRPDQLSAALRNRILQAAHEIGYAGPDPVARMLRTGRAGTLGLILPESLPFTLDDAPASAIVRGIADACEERRLGLLIVAGAMQSSDPRAISDVAVDGFVLYSLPRTAPALAPLLARGAPLVVVDQPSLPGVPCVAIDDALGAREAARHLLDLGHRRIGVVSLPFHPDGYLGPADAERRSSSAFDVTARRLAGYGAALTAAGLDEAALPVFECPHSDEELGRRAGRHLLALSPAPTAILAMTDRLAFGVLAAARELHVDVPARLSVVGFDDVDAAARSRPALTTVRQPLRLKGYAAARLLLDAPGAEEPPARAEGAVEPAAVDLPVELVTRRSTAQRG